MELPVAHFRRTRMASYDYRVIVTVPGHAEVDVSAHPGAYWTSATAAIRARAYCSPGTRVRIERRAVGTVGRSGCKHTWLLHRTFVVDANGVSYRA
jgi:hypothetical protein